MKLRISIVSIAAGFLLATVNSTLAQVLAAPAAVPATEPQAQPGNQDEKAEDAALLQQLEQTTPQGQARLNNNKNKELWAPAASGRAGGVGGMAYRAQPLLARPSGAGRTLLVRNSSPDPKAQGELEEDLAVMSHILNKGIEDLAGGQGRLVNALGVDVYFTPDGSQLRNLYLDNYGAVFFLNVGFPLIASQEKQSEEKPAGDSAWEVARQEVYGRHQEQLMGEPAEDYSQEKVERLKTTLLEALKNASNIRELKGDEFVTLFVSGGASGGSGRFRVTRRTATGGLGANTMQVDQPTPASRRTVLTIRASKADVDSYAKGKLSAAEFEKRVRIASYPGDPAGNPGDPLAVGGFYTGRNRF